MRKTWRGSKKIKPFGMEKAKELVRKHFFECYGDYTNERKAHCKVCGGEIPKGKGNQWYFWSGEMRCRHPSWQECNCDWYYNSNFVCDKCQKELESFQHEMRSKEQKRLAPTPLMDIDRRVRWRLKIDLDEVKRQYEEYGEWYENVFEPNVPISQIELPKVWNEARYKNNFEKIKATGGVPPIFLGYDEATKAYKISDGIHRVHAVKDLGFTHIPAVVAYRRTHRP